MTNQEKLQSVFIEIFNVKSENLNELTYQSIPEWDSVGHMALISLFEETFEIMLDTEDIIDFSSYEKGIEILRKYEVGI